MQETDSKENEIDDSETSDALEAKEPTEEGNLNDEKSHSQNDQTSKENENDLETTNLDEDDRKSTHKETEIHDNGNDENHHKAEEQEGNNNTSDNSEDDDDVQVPGDTPSEYSDTNLKSTADVSSMGSAHIGKNEISSGTAHEILKT